ncbi:putative exonuclease, partial [Escherichia coli EC1869]
TEQIHY